MRRQRLRPGSDERRVREVIARCKDQTHDEQSAEIQVALEAELVTMVAVPAVRTLLEQKRKYSCSKPSAFDRPHASPAESEERQVKIVER